MDKMTPGTDTKAQSRRNMYARHAIEAAIDEYRNRLTVTDKDGKPCDVYDMFY